MELDEKTTLGEVLKSLPDATILTLEQEGGSWYVQTVENMEVVEEGEVAKAPTPQEVGEAYVMELCLASEKLLKAPTRKMDYEGLEVVSLYEIKNGAGSMPEGTSWAVSHVSRGLNLDTKPCNYCGSRMYVSRVEYDEVVIPNTPYNQARLAWNKLRYYDKSQWGRLLINPLNIPVPTPEDFPTDH